MKKLLLSLILGLSIIPINSISADGDEYPFIITDNTLFLSDYDNPRTVEEIISTLIATDDKDGDISDQITIFSDTFTGNEKVIGDHMISVQVTDSNNQSTRIMLIVRVADITSPVIEGVKDYQIDIGHEAIDFNDGILITDNYDGDITNNLMIVGDDLIDYSSYGTYEVSYITMDSFGNTTMEYSTVVIKDMVDPVITGIETVVKSVDDLLTINDIIYKINAVDNIDGDLSSMLIVTEDLYTGHGDVVGEYPITFTIVDTSGNSTEHIVTVNVIANIPNILYFDNVTLQLSKDGTVDNDEIKLLLTGVGELDRYSNYAVEILKDEYTSNKTLSGEYEYVVRYISNSGEVVVKSFNIIVDYSQEDVTYIGEDEPSAVLEHFTEYWKLYVVTISIIGAGTYIIKFRP